MPGLVRVVYLVPSDRKENPEYTQAIRMAINEVQEWYAAQLGGAKFSRKPIEVTQSRRPADWFGSNPRPGDPDSRFFYNALDEVNRLAGARPGDPANCWVIYVDAPGNKGRGGDGVCVLPGDDLLGLVGRHPTQKSRRRWVGGLAHELGHALGLPHPTDTATHASAIMWLGYIDPAHAYLTPDDKRRLSTSPFFGR